MGEPGEWNAIIIETSYIQGGGARHTVMDLSWPITCAGGVGLEDFVLYMMWAQFPLLVISIAYGVGIPLAR